MAGLPTWLTACKEAATPDQLIFFTPDELQVVEEVADTILPDTPDSPGAKAAGIGPFMDRYVGDCLEVSAQEVLRSGLAILDQRSREAGGRSFLALSPDQRHELLVKLDMEAEEQQPAGGPHYFSLLKGLTLLGYFTSEAGATQALRYVPVPGKYDGSIPYEAGDKAWAL